MTATTVDAYIEKKLAEKEHELQVKEAKDKLVDHKKDDSAARALKSKFYAAVASGDPMVIAETNSIIEKDYRSKAQTEGGVTTGTSGGILVPQTVADSIVDKMKYISPIRQIATVFTMDSEQLMLPSENAIQTAYWVAEATAPSDTSEIFDPNILTPFKLAALNSFTREIIAGAATNPSIQAYVERRMAVALALAENAGFANGTGSTQPYGFRSSAITPNSVAQNGAALAYADVVKTFFTTPIAYRSQSVWVTPSAGVQALVNVKDSQGRPIWIDSFNGLRDGTPATIFGRPVYIVEEVPSNLGAGTNATELWFGDFSNYFIGDRLGLTVDYGLQGTDFASDKISLRSLKRVAGRPTIGEGFTKCTGVISGA
jgi:HK97 family phage major capsid protein